MTVSRPLERYYKKRPQAKVTLEKQRTSEYRTKFS